MVKRCSVALALCSLLGCKAERHADIGAGGPTASTSVAARAAGPDASAAAAPSFDATAARAFVERWVAAQNQHDFAAYSTLYAAHFEGTKRVGSYSKRFDRAAWLRDRQPMFRDGVIVQAAALRVSGSAGAVRAVFTQDFVAPGFHDSGTKELFLVAQPSGLAISREEMLASQVAVVAPLADSALLAFHRDGPVLASGFAQALPGTPRLLPRAASDSYDVALPIEPASLSEATRAWLGRTVTVYAKGGSPCQGTVSRFEVRVKAVPHFGMRQTWDGEGGVPKASSAQIAGEIWSMASDDERFVVGVLDHECHGVWAVTRAVGFTPASAPPVALRARALTAFKALPAYRELQARFAESSTNPGTPWETVDGTLTVVELRLSAQLAWVVVAARGGVGCGGFGGNLSAIWKADGEASAAKLTLRGTFKDLPDLLQVNGAVDQNQDGTPELLAGPDTFADEISVLRLAAAGYERSVLLRTSVWDCGC